MEDVVGVLWLLRLNMEAEEVEVAVVDISNEVGWCISNLVDLQPNIRPVDTSQEKEWHLSNLVVVCLNLVGGAGAVEVVVLQVGVEVVALQVGVEVVALPGHQNPSCTKLLKLHSKLRTQPSKSHPGKNR